MDWEGENITIEFQPVPPQLIDISSCHVVAEPIQSTSPEIEKKNLNFTLGWTPILQILNLN